MDGEWKAALRLQIEALAKRNELHRRHDADESIRLRAQVGEHFNCAKFYATNLIVINILTIF